MTQITTATASAHLTPEQRDAMAAILAPPLRPKPDMAGRWLSFGKEGVPFDVAAARLERWHEEDGGQMMDEDVYDVLSCMVGQDGGTFILADPASRKSWPLRNAALADLLGNGYLDLNGGGRLVRDKLPPALQLATLNTLIQRKKAQMRAEGGKERLPAVIRSRAGQACAIVSPTYAPLDVPDLLQIVRDQLREHGALNEVAVTDIAHGNTDAIRLAWPTGAVEPRVGDTVRRGLDFRNSGLGHSSLWTTASLFRLACLNGMTREIENGRSAVQHRGSRERMVAAVRTNVQGALHEGTIAAEQFRASVAVNVMDVAKVMASLQTVYGWNVGEATIAKNNVIEAHPGPWANGMPQLPAATDLYTLTNAITAAARVVGEGIGDKEGDPDRRLELEATAGAFLRRHSA